MGPPTQIAGAGRNVGGKERAVFNGAGPGVGSTPGAGSRRGCLLIATQANLQHKHLPKTRLQVRLCAFLCTLECSIILSVQQWPTFRSFRSRATKGAPRNGIYKQCSREYLSFATPQVYHKSVSHSFHSSLRRYKPPTPFCSAMAATALASSVTLVDGVHGLQTGHELKSFSSQHGSSLFGGSSIQLKKSAGVHMSATRSQQISAACGPCKRGYTNTKGCNC